MLSDDFISMLRDALGTEAAEKVCAGLEGQPSVSIRLNPAKAGHWMPEDAVRVPWSPFGYLLKERPSFTADPLFHAGVYYVQDSSAMAVGEVFRQAIDLAGAVKLRVLDLCAAPGGKTTDLAASLRQSGTPFLLVANEIMRDRAGVLKNNVALWGDSNVAVTSVSPATFAPYESFFDIIVADVPCSGEGMFRKEPAALRDWSVDTVEMCRERSRRIISDVWPALREGGLLVFSTCTFNREENDCTVAWAAAELGAEILPVTLPDRVPGWAPIKTEHGLCLAPGFVPGEGQYVALLRKSSDAGTGAGKSGGATDSGYAVSGKMKRQKTAAGPGKAGKDLQRYASMVDFPARVSLRGDTLIAFPMDIAADMDILDALKPLASGVALGTLKGSDLVPSADLALCTAIRRDAFPRQELSREDALAFLRRDSILTPDAPKGFVLVTYKGHPLGFVKNLGNRTNNLHPLSRRILTCL